LATSSPNCELAKLHVFHGQSCMCALYTWSQPPILHALADFQQSGAYCYFNKVFELLQVVEQQHDSKSVGQRVCSSVHFEIFRLLNNNMIQNLPANVFAQVSISTKL